jgi:hypothetical protein
MILDPEGSLTLKDLIFLSAYGALAGLNNKKLVGLLLLMFSGLSYLGYGYAYDVHYTSTVTRTSILMPDPVERARFLKALNEEGILYTNVAMDGVETGEIIMNAQIAKRLKKLIPDYYKQDK